MKDGVSQAVRFTSELERLKCITRQNRTLDSGRFENSAEHSWHIAVMAMVFERYLPYRVDLSKVLKMLLIHDIVEIDAGDAYFYDDEARLQAQMKEAQAAERIFGSLPDDQKQELLEIWEEFERFESAEAKYAKALDALQPLINHVLTGEPGVNVHGLKKSKIIEKKQFIKSVSDDLWEVVSEMIDRAVKLEIYLDE